MVFDPVYRSKSNTTSSAPSPVSSKPKLFDLGMPWNMITARPPNFVRRSRRTRSKGFILRVKSMALPATKKLRHKVCGRYQRRPQDLG